MYKRYTERARKVINLAQKEALKLKHNYIGTEHILLGLITEKSGMGVRILQALGIDLDTLRLEVVRSVGRGVYPGGGEMAFTPRAKKVLEYALDEAKRLQHNYVGTEHILLGLIREKGGVAAHILSGMGVDIDTARIQLIQLLAGENAGFVRVFSSVAANQTSQEERENTPVLNSFAVDLTQLAREERLDPIIGRKVEIQRLIQILSRRTKNNPVLVGEAGVGKTAIIEGFAQKIINNEVPDSLKNKRLVSLDLASIVAGTKYRGEFEKRLKKILEEIRASKNIILFIDEIHTLIGAGGAEGTLDAANILKPALARGEIQAIGATTYDEYRKYIEKDAALERRFQPIYIEEPSVSETIEILKGLKKRYEDFHRVEILDSALSAASRLSSQYIIGRYLPDKAIDVIDEASARVKIENIETSPIILKIEDKLKKIKEKKDKAIKAQKFEEAAILRDEEERLAIELVKVKEEFMMNTEKYRPIVSEEDVAKVVSSWTGIPLSRLAEEETQKLLKMEAYLHEKIVGQDEAIRAISKAIRRARAGLKDPKRPIGSFIFLGPTGVGKTALSKAIAEFLFGNEEALVKIDMSEYMEKHSVSRLIGSPPGYVGYEDGGQLSEKIRKRPYSVVLLDEIEKAHPDVFNLLLQILEDGKLTDSRGRKIDFKNTILIMTSNLGVRYLQYNTNVGFKKISSETGDMHYDDIKKKVSEELKKAFRPEFLNRIDEIIVFRPLNRQEIGDIMEIMLQDIKDRLNKQGILDLVITERLKKFLVNKGYNPLYGARPLRRVLERYIEDAIAEKILTGEIGEGDIVIGDIEKDEPVFMKKEFSSVSV